MKPIRIMAMAAVAGFIAGAGAASPLTLTLANPQPAKVKEGLAVEYAYPKDVSSLRDAAAALKAGAKLGTPLAGLDYLASDSSPFALTSGQEFKVAARIKGYLKFDAPGTYTLEFYSNDGLDLSLGGQGVAKVDNKRDCDPIGAVEVRISEAGWYDLEALYWQRKGGSCLIMEWSKDGGELEAVPAEAFGFK
jgi:hypothetical protein